MPAELLVNDLSGGYGLVQVLHGVNLRVSELEWSDPPLLIPGIGVETGEGDGFPKQVVMMEWDTTSWVTSEEILDAAELAGD